jgi:dTDP-6-deoxy-L-talose 4-dehydrogenase (NAD+)
MRILLTGATGFIGSAFLQLALASGHEVGALVRAERIPMLSARAGMTVLDGTLQDPPWEEIRGFGADVCLHTSWVTEPGVYLESPANYAFLDWSQQFLTRLFDLGLRRVVALGTCIEHRISQPPVSAYVRSKDQLRRVIQTEAARRNVEAGWCRIFYPYGVGEDPARLCSSLIRKLAQGEKVTLQTPESTKDYIYIDDLAMGLLTILDHHLVGESDLGSGTEVTVRTIAETIAEIMERPGAIGIATPPVPDPFSHLIADTARLRAAGWQPRTSLREGLARLVHQLTK